MSAVRLMRREGGHWQEVARENIEGSDIEERLTAMIAQVDDGSCPVHWGCVMTRADYIGRERRWRKDR